MIFGYAEKEDKDLILKLALEALGDYGLFLSLSKDYDVALKRLSKFFNHELVNPLHNTSFIIGKYNGEIVGEISLYKGSQISLYNGNLCKIISEFQEDQSLIDATIASLYDSFEANNDEYYLDTISISKKYQQQGMAGLFIDEACRLAKKEGLNKLALVVQEGKEYLVDFYIKYGFELFENKNLVGINYYRMIKKL